MSIELVDTIVQTAPLVLAEQTTVHYHYSGTIRMGNSDVDDSMIVNLWIEVDGLQVPGTFRDVSCPPESGLNVVIASHGVQQSAAGAHTIDIVAVRIDGNDPGTAQTAGQAMLTGEIYTIP